MRSSGANLIAGPAPHRQIAFLLGAAA